MEKYFFWLFLICAGCSLAPSNKTPEMNLADSFVEAPKEVISQEEDLHLWWKQFDDPELNGLIETALNENYDVRIAIEKIHEMRAQYRIQASQLWPQIKAKGQELRVRLPQAVTSPGNAPAPLFSSPLQNLYLAGFDASWEIDLFGKIRNQKKAAYFSYLSTEEEMHNVKISLISEVATTYTDIRALQKRVLIARNNIESQEEIVALAQSRYENGLIPESALDSAWAFLDALRATLPSLESALKQQIYSLAVLLGKPPEEMAGKFSEEGNLPVAEGKIPIGLPSALLARRPDVRKAERDLFSSNAQIGVAKAALLPDFSLTGAYEWVAAHFHNWFKPPTRFWYIGPSFTWQLFDGGKTWANIRVQNSKQKQALLNYKKTVISSLQEVENALVAYAEEGKRQLFLSDQVAMNARQEELSDNLFLSGLTDLSTLLQVVQNVYQAEDALIQSRQALMTNLIAVYKALGGGWQEIKQ